MPLQTQWLLDTCRLGRNRGATTTVRWLQLAAINCRSYEEIQMMLIWSQSAIWELHEQTRCATGAASRTVDTTCYDQCSIALPLALRFKKHRHVVVITYSCDVLLRASAAGVGPRVRLCTLDQVV
jgi:hypothetical protein